MYVHEPCVFISITSHLSIIPSSLQEVSTLFTLLCVYTQTLCLHFYHISSINNTCITTASKYSFYIVMCMYIHKPCVFISITPHLSIIPSSLQQVSTLFTMLCVCTRTLCLHFYHTSSINNTCITTGGKYSFYIVMCMYTNLVSSFLSHLIYQ